MKKLDTIHFIRQSPVILISKIFVAELIINLVYFIPRIIKVYFSGALGQENFFVLNQLSLGLYIFVTVIQLIAVIYIVLEWSNNIFVIRQNEILHRRGVFTLKEDTYSLRNVEAFMLNQSFLGKVFNFGTIHFYSPVLKQEYYIHNVSSPSLVKESIEEVISVHRQQTTNRMIIPKK